MVIWDQANTLLPFLLAPLGNVVENPCFPWISLMCGIPVVISIWTVRKYEFINQKIMFLGGIMWFVGASSS